MHYLLLILSGFIMGLIAAVPIGPVNLICVRRTFAFGPLNGFVSGLGAALGDGIFATIIELIGGALLVVIGYRMFMAPASLRMDAMSGDKEGATLVGAIASTFALTITNPVTLGTFFLLFAGLGGLAGGAGSYNDAGFVGAGGWE